MEKLVVLTAGLTDRSIELQTERTTIGRVEDNTFQIAEGSVSSHHCEVLLRGSDVVIKDLNSTNGTFINGDKITEAVLRPGQTLRLGSIDLKLEGEGVAGKKQLDQTRQIPRGVQLNQLEQGGAQPVKFDKNPFAKKNNKVAMIFKVVGVILGIAIIGSIIMAVLKMGEGGK